MSRRRKGDAVNGWLCLDKPLQVTSTQAVGRVRRLFQAQKAGHAGTLDPLATGVLPIAFGEATKAVGYLQDSVKDYRFTLRWGQQTATDDAEGAVTQESDVIPEAAAIEAALPAFVGEIEQVPPAFSAVKVDGKRAYDLARADAPATLAPRKVRIESLAYLGASPDGLTGRFRMTSRKGVYVRALARDLGLHLNSRAHVVALHRAAVGPFSDAEAIPLESLEQLEYDALRDAYLRPVETALDDIPALVLSEGEATQLKRGQAVSLLARVHRERLRPLSQGGLVCATSSGKMVAVARYEAGAVHPVRVFNL